MPYAFSALFFILALTTGIPALLQLRRMETIKRSSATTSGVVRMVGRSNIGWNFLGEVGRSARPLVAFHVGDKEFEVEMTDNSGFMNRRYDTGNTVEVVYQKEEPWKAYLTMERTFTRRDLWIALGEIALAMMFWGIGVYLKIPFST
ncbi:MAG TPA: hypothetical protein PLT08_17165 [Anaerolineales bacterium]|nr:hypothetical protein [Anaerolineales bacterium]